MASGKFLRAVFFGAVKLSILAAMVYLVSASALKASEATLPSSKDICERVQSGTTIEQIDSATRTGDGGQAFRDDGVMVISTRSYRDKFPVCRVTIDPGTPRATAKAIGLIQPGDRPTL